MEKSRCKHGSTGKLHHHPTQQAVFSLGVWTELQLPSIPQKSANANEQELDIHWLNIEKVTE